MYSRAAKLFYARTDVRYITESSPSTDGNLGSQIDRYTNTNSYEYILEVDSAGKVVGGEWARGSKRSHPDFAWLPVRIRNESVAGGKIRWSNVKQILDLSVAAATPRAPSTRTAPSPRTTCATSAPSAWPRAPRSALS